MERMNDPYPDRRGILCIPEALAEGVGLPRYASGYAGGYDMQVALMPALRAANLDTPRFENRCVSKKEGWEFPFTHPNVWPGGSFASPVRFVVTQDADGYHVQYENSNDGGDGDGPHTTG